MERHVLRCHMLDYSVCIRPIKRTPGKELFKTVLYRVFAAYHDILKAAGVDVSLKTIKGVPHAFWGWPGKFNKLS